MLMVTLCSTVQEKPADNLKSGRYGSYSQCWIRITKSQKYPYPFLCSMILRFCNPSPGNCEPCLAGQGLSSSPRIIQRDGHKVPNVQFPYGFLMHLLCSFKDCIFHGLAQKSTTFNITGYNQEFNFHNLQVTLKLQSQVTRKPGSSGLSGEADSLQMVCLLPQPSVAPSGKEVTRRAVGRENATMQSFSSSIKQPSSNASEGIRMWSGHMKTEQMLVWSRTPGNRSLFSREGLASQNEFKSQHMKV